MNEHRWFNPTQPQTLQMAVILLYIDSVLLLVYGAVQFLPYLVATVAMGAGGFGIASDKKWGYALGVFGAVLQAALAIYLGLNLLNLIFSVALVALLLHPMSRDYQRIWFH